MPPGLRMPSINVTARTFPIDQVVRWRAPDLSAINYDVIAMHDKIINRKIELMYRKVLVQLEFNFDAR